MNGLNKSGYKIPIRHLLGVFISATVGFLGISAVGIYWAFISIAPAPGATIRATASANSDKVIDVYFGNSSLDAGVEDCGSVYPAERMVTKTPGIARVALTELLLGPSWDEANRGFYTEINSGTPINSLAIVDGVARVDLGKRIEEGLGGSCRVAAIRSQITSTLKQFPSVTSVVISVDGRTDDALQP